MHYSTTEPLVTIFQAIEDLGRMVQATNNTFILTQLIDIGLHIGIPMILKQDFSNGTSFLSETAFGQGSKPILKLHMSSSK